MLTGYEPIPGSEKEIAGRPHVKVKCAVCGEVITVNASRYCKDGLYRRKVYSRAPDKAAGTDMRYHGEFQ